jgi:hypothetical protein
MRAQAWVGAAFVFVFMLALSIAAQAQTAPVVLGKSTVPLYGGWRFHTGDNPHWKDPAFDDASWESVDLTPKPGAHDADVGVRGWVPGWSARGHKDYSGWYRLRLTVHADGPGPLAIEGPPYIDGAYQLFLNGRLLGGQGRFDGRTPTVYSRQPRKFVVPADAVTQGPVEIAIRVYEPRALVRGDPTAGGVQAAPSIGEADAVGAEHKVRRMEVFWGYFVDGVEGLAFLGLAGLAALVMAFDRARAPAYRWMILGLVAMGLARGNQSVFAWLQIEDLGFYDIFRNGILTALGPLAWTMVWRAWFGPDRPAWGGKAIIGLGAVYGLLALATRSELHLLPDAALPVVRIFTQAIRLVFLASWLLSAGVGVVRERARAALPLLTLLTVGVAIFVQEVDVLGVRGIWFPFGVGVSRTEYASAVFDVILAVWLIVELLRHAPRSTVEASVATE